jgi:hypothetical protein
MGDTTSINSAKTRKTASCACCGGPCDPAARHCRGCAVQVQVMVPRIEMIVSGWQIDEHGVAWRTAQARP